MVTLHWLCFINLFSYQLALNIYPGDRGQCIYKDRLKAPEPSNLGQETHTEESIWGKKSCLPTIMHRVAQRGLYQTVIGNGINNLGSSHQNQGKNAPEKNSKKVAVETVANSSGTVTYGWFGQYYGRIYSIQSNACAVGTGPVACR